MSSGMMGAGSPFGILDVANNAQERLAAATERLADAAERQVAVEWKILSVLTAIEKHTAEARRFAGEV